MAHSVQIRIPARENPGSESVARQGGDISRSDPGPDLRARMSDKLQSLVELDTLLTAFLESVNQAVKLDGVHYSNADYGIDRSIARQSIHSCGYRLITTHERLGEIVFKRAHKFTEQELATLESLLSLLIHPLRNSLQHNSDDTRSSATNAEHTPSG